MYYGRVLNGTIENIYLNTGSPLGQYTTTYKTTTAGAPTFSNLSASGAAAQAAPSAYFFDKHVQNPQVQEFDLILQQNLGKTAVLNVSYLGGLGRELPNFVDLNLNPATKTAVVQFKGGGPIADGTTINVPTYVGYGNTAMFGALASKFQAITEAVEQHQFSSYNALVAEVKTRDFHGLETDASYTWSHASGLLAERADTGWRQQRLRSVWSTADELWQFQLQRAEPLCLVCDVSLPQCSGRGVVQVPDEPLVVEQHLPDAERTAVLGVT